MKTGLWLALLLLALVVPTAGAQDAAQGGQTAEPPPLTIANQFYDSAVQAFQAQEFDAALLNISTFVFFNPTDSQGYFVRAVIQLQRAEPASALADVDQALTLAASDLYPDAFRVRLYNLRADVHGQLEDVDAALEDYEQALTISPTIETYVNRSFLYGGLEAFDTALADIDSALELAGDDVEQQSRLYLIRAGLSTANADVSGAALDYFNYALRILSDEQTSDPMDSGQALQFSITPGVVVSVPIVAEAGQRMSVLAEAANGVTFDPLVILLAPDNTPLIASDDIAANDLRAGFEGFELPESGQYLLLLTHAGGPNTGDVVLRMILEDAAAGN